MCSHKAVFAIWANAMDFHNKKRDDMESLDERLARIEREAEDMPRLDKLNDQALRMLLKQHLRDFCQMSEQLANKSFAEIAREAQPRRAALDMLLRECEIRGQYAS